MCRSQIESPAFLALSAVAKECYWILRDEYKGEEWTGNSVICPYSTMIKKGMTRNSIPKALRILSALGFIEYESGGLEHQPNVYHFSCSWIDIKTKRQAEEIVNKVVEEMKLEKENKKKVIELYGT